MGKRADALNMRNSERLGKWFVYLKRVDDDNNFIPVEIGIAEYDNKPDEEDGFKYSILVDWLGSKSTAISRANIKKIEFGLAPNYVDPETKKLMDVVAKW